jgi:hypothetical protein
MGSITFNGDEHYILARLQSACPPIARRPHQQEGFLIGHFPIYTLNDHLKEQSRLVRRLVAKFTLEDKGKFWDTDFSVPTKNSLLPTEDPLLKRLIKEFGPHSPIFSLQNLAQQL